MKKITFCIVLFQLSLFAQDMDEMMNQLSEGNNFEVEATYKSTWLVLSQTNETQNAKDLNFWIAHRFGDIGGEFGGASTFYGLDVATDLYIGFDYGITDHLTVGIGRSKYNETYNGLIKYKLLRQSDKMPVSVTLFDQLAWITREEFSNNEFSQESDRISNFFQAVITKKFSPGLSLMLSPGLLMRPDAQLLSAEDQNNLFALSMGGRLKLFKRISLLVDYTLVEGLGREASEELYNPLGIGIEFETGGHVFSLNFQNSQYIIANNFIPNTSKSWTDGGVRFGFAISRNFSLGKKKNN